MTQASSDQQRYRLAAWWMGLLAILLMQLSGMARAESGVLTRFRADSVQTPIYFEPNLGQSADPVKFLARGPGYALFLTADEAVLALHSIQSSNPPAVIRTRLEGAARNPEPRLEGLERLPSISNYLLGNDRAKWRTQVPHYRRVRYAEVYPGIDLVYYGNPQQLEHDFIVAPDADPAQIQLAISGAERVRVNAEGDLILTVPGGEVVQQAPRIYQVIDGQQQSVAGRYVLRHSESAATTVNIAVADPMLEPLRVGFEIAHYDPQQPLVIDPVLVYSTFLGGIKEDYGTSIAVDHNGFAYVTGGTTSSLDFPIAGGGSGPPLATNTKQDAFVSKFDFSETGVDSLLCSTYLGGSSDDEDDIGYAIAVDNIGFVYVTGTTASANFPTISSGTLNGGKDAFIVVLDANCALSFSTYWGGNKDDEGRGIAVHSSLIYVTGYTSSNFSDGFPLQNPFQPALLGGTDAFVSVIDTTSTPLLPMYSTYVGGAKDDKGAAIAVDGNGLIYLTGSTASTNFPVTGLAFDTTLGGSLDGFIAKIDPFSFPAPNGRYSLLYSAYVGGSGADSGAGIAVDSGRHAYVTGSTASSNFPMTPNAAQSNYRGSGDAFVAKIDPDPTLVGMSSLLYSTYLGGSGVDSGTGIVVIEPASAIRTYVTGATASANFPVTSDAMDATLGGNGDAFVAQLSDTGKQWLYVTYLGGNNGIDSGAGIAADVSATGSNIYITGATNANDFPFTANAFYTINNNVKDVFVVKLEGSSFSMSITRVGSGTVTSSPPGILCGTDCTEIYTAGASITLTATRASGYQFTGWSGGVCSGSIPVCTVPMNADKSVTATFAPITYALTVSKAGTGSGVTSSGGSYAAGAMLNLTATPNAGSIFVGWSPSPCATSFAMPASNLTCTATFNQSNQTLGSAVGVFRNGQWYLDANGNGAWDGCGVEFCLISFGQAGDLPVSGNWNGGTKLSIGVFRNGQWVLDTDGNGQWDGCSIDSCNSSFGQGGDQPVAGDWNGDGKAKIGVFRNGQWILDSNGNGAWDGCGTDLCLSFGQAGDIPIAGKWNGGLKAGVGVFRAGTWYLDYNGNGIWDGCEQDGGADQCLYGSFGQGGDLPVAGDWNGDGKAKVGVFRNGIWYLDHNGNGEWDGCSVDRCYFDNFGQAGDWPVAGKWQ